MPRPTPPLLEKLRERFLAWRDRRIADPGFRAWAARFPLTRPKARAEARALFDLCSGFIYSQVLLSCVQLRLFEALAAGPLPEAVLASRARLGPEAMARLVDAAASLRLLRRTGGGEVGLGSLGAAMVGNAGLAAMIEHHALVYRDLADPVALLRGEQAPAALAAYWPYAAEGPHAALDDAAVAPYTALMAATQPLVSAEVLGAYDFSRHRCLLDVGGGDGSFLAAIGAAHPHLSLHLFDLPAVAARAGARFAAAGLAARARMTGGDFLRDPLPTGADVISLVRVIHDHDEGRVAAILRAAHAALPPGGTLLVAEPLADTPGAEPIGAAYFGFYLLAMGRGRARGVAALSGLLADAGFSRIRQRPTHTPLLTGLVVAERPG
ncbi:MAG: acetylserotonin O-methyltransferase [Acetobacteraceae bacterium]|nr:acetylserotonin O-methyltransferase [Acetobacteraceae bacterium]